MQDLFTAVAVYAQNTWFRFRDEETAQGLVEYALIIVVVSLGTIAALTFLRDEIRNLFSRAGSSLRTGG
jgi:Flp pilus assembly pilin Flp